jgi:ribonucleoside-diphosphate reductase alpha chain
MPNKKVVLSKNAEEVAKARYFNDGEDWESCSRRVAEAVAAVEKDKDLWTEKFGEMIYNMDFLGGGRILRNSGRTKGSMLNCYHLGIADSITEIGEFMKSSLVVWSGGGGVGTNMSTLRPKGAPILGKGGVSSGMVTFLIAADGLARTIESGGQRRAAGLAACDVSHPEIFDFIDCKTVHGAISHFNISVMVNDEFMEAVERDDDWDLKFKQKIYKTVKARDIWNKIIYNMVHHAEPGLLNSSNLMKNNSYYFAPISGVNPCWTGDTLVAVADGRGEVSFKQLAEERKDIPVYCFNPDTKEVEIKMMRNPRMTSRKEKILKIILDDGSILRCNETHKIVNKNGFEVMAKDLKIGDRLHHMVKNYNINSKGKQEPVSICNGYGNKKGYCFEHRIQAEFLIGRKLLDSESAHHKDENNQNNTLENIIVMDHGEHSKLHQSGKNNVMRDKWWNNQPEEVKNEYRKNMSNSTSGSKNGNWSGYTLEELKNIACSYMSELGRKINVKEWVEYCRQNNYPLITARMSFINEWYDSLNLNYKVLLIEEDGYESVYNGTVDDFHNYYVYTKTIKNKKTVKNYILSKNCGEATLSESESCCLGSLVLPNFITGNVNTNWQKLERIIKTAVRFLDNVIDVNIYDLRKIDEKTHNSRRIGLGVMGLADYLFSKKLRYGSKEAIIEVEKLVRFIRDVSYQASVEIAMEKGSFPKFDPVMFGKASFVRKLPGSLRMDIKNHGIRNVTLMSFAPTGSSSLIPECVGGVEPLMFKSYRRKDRVSERVYVHPKYKELLLSGEPVPDWFVDASDLQPKDHFEIQAAVQRYCDGSVSKTINMPKGTSEEQLSSYLLEYIHDLKGTTVYIDGTREGQVYNNLTEEETFDIIANQTVGVNHNVDLEDVECNCQKPKDENGEEVEGCEIPNKGDHQ